MTRRVVIMVMLLCTLGLAEEGWAWSIRRPRPLTPLLRKANIRALLQWNPSVASRKRPARNQLPRREYITSIDRRLVQRDILPADTGSTSLRWIDGLPASNEEEPCSSSVFRRFLLDGDTLSVTWGLIAETCTDAPRFVLSERGRATAQQVLPMLKGWNVVALWINREYVALGLTATHEGGITHDRIACLWIGRGEWYWTPDRLSLTRRPGFDLGSLLPDWQASRLAADHGGSLVFRGSERALVLRPFDRTWNLVDVRTADPILLPRHRTRGIAARALNPSPVPARLEPAIRAAFARRNPGLDSLVVLEVIDDPCDSRLDSRGLVVRATDVRFVRSGAHPEFVGEGVAHDREVLGVFLADTTLTRLESVLGFFPSGRWLDYTAYFDLDAPADSVAVWGEGETYGDDPRRFSYPCPP